MISIQKIPLEELERFISSDAFKALKNKPISKARVNSYLTNTRAKSTDVVLFMAFHLEELVGYRTVWADTFCNENKKESFGWLSGSWVHPEYRRKGISTLIFNAVLKEWNGRLMYTNYAEASKSLYDKTEQFSFLQELKGTKFYIRFSLADILPQKKRIYQSTKWIWKRVDGFLNVFLDAKNLMKSFRKETEFYAKTNEPWNNTIDLFLEKFISQNLFRRSEKEFKWIKNYPWILSDEKTKRNAKAYFFSMYAKEFESNFYTIYADNDRLIGCILITIRDGHLKIPYAYFLEENTSQIGEFIVNLSIYMKVKTMVVYQGLLEDKLNNKLSFITKKAFTQKYFITKELEKFFIESKKYQIQPGDGDVVFT